MPYWLEQAGLIGRSIGMHDKRRRTLSLTKAGERMLDRLAEPAKRAQANVLSAFTTQERAEFIRLLDKFVAKFNDTTRVPLEAHRATAKRKRAPSDPSSVAARR